MVSQSRAELISDDVSARVAFSFGGLSIYEYLVTFDMEVAIVWQRRKTAMSVLLLSIRWVMLLNGVLAVVPPVMSSTEYVAQQVMQNALTLTGFIQVAVFSMLRVRAFTSKSYMLPGIVLILSFTPFVTNIYTMTHGTFTVVDSSYNFVTPGMTPSQHKQMSVMTRCALILADAIVLAVTWSKMFRQWRMARSVNMDVSTTSFLVNGGTLYFIALLAMNLAVVVADTATAAGAATTQMLAYLPLVIASRFLLNLRACGDVAGAGGPSALSTLRFATLDFPESDGEALHGVDEDGEAASGAWTGCAEVYERTT